MMRTLWSMTLAVGLCASTLDIGGQAPTSSPQATTPTSGSLQIEIDHLKAEISELRRQLVRRGVLSELSRDPISIGGRPSVGDNSAPLVLVEFVDFECSFCARHASTTFKLLQTRYMDTKIVQYVVKSLPLESIHPLAFRAATVAECGHRQQRYWPIHDLLFDNPRRLQDVSGLAKDGGLDRAAFDLCLSDPGVSAQVRDEIGEAERLGIQGTPSFVLGKRIGDGRSMQPGVVLSGVLPIDKFAAAIDATMSGSAAPSR